MFYSTLLLAATTFTGLVSAQNYSTSGPISVVPDSVSITLRESWCRAQTGSCPQICGGQANPNTCDPDTLQYQCTCTSGAQPNISSYDATIPSFVCAQWQADCVLAHPNDLDGQTGCLSVVCGAKNPANASNAESGTGGMPSASGSAMSTMASPTPTPTPTGSSGSASSSAAAAASSSAASTGGAVALHLANNYGTGLLTAGLFAIFGLAL